MTLRGMLERGTLRSQTGCPQVCFIWSSQVFHIFKNVLPTFKGQEISQKRSNILGFPFKTRSSGHTVQYCHLARISQRQRRAALCRRAEVPRPQHLTPCRQVLENIQSVTPAPKQFLSPEGFSRII